MALFGGAHIRKGSGIIMLLYPRHINEHASIICMYIYYRCIYIAVFGSDDTVVGPYTVGHALL